jgi:hypothetical protein
METVEFLLNLVDLQIKIESAGIYWVGDFEQAIVGM